jgi:hypothetical protein
MHLRRRSVALIGVAQGLFLSGVFAFSSKDLSKRAASQAQRIARSSRTLLPRFITSNFNGGPRVYVGLQPMKASAAFDDSSSLNPDVEKFIEQLTDDYKALIASIWEEASLRQETQKAEGSASLIMAATVEKYLQTISPSLIVMLRQFASSTSPEDVGNGGEAGRNSTTELASKARAMGLALSTVLDAKLEKGRDLLQAFLGAGELRKLDSLIGKAAREGQLDSSFFTVLSMNLNDAAESNESALSTTIENTQSDSEQPEGASRMSILQHMYTRCQEEMEKQVPPGVGLLNKLMRTEQPSIRKNQLEHYLGLPESKSIQAPDGTSIQLKDGGKALVPPDELVLAIQNIVKQVRLLEKSGATTKEGAAGVIEGARSIAKEARIVVGELYGVKSKLLIDFENGLMPVFRPSPSEPEYMPASVPASQVATSQRQA